MTSAESAALMDDPVFQGRVKVDALRYADTLTIQAVPASSHTRLLVYAAETFQSPNAMAQRLVPLVVMDSAVQADGADISDAALQGAVEATVNKLYS